MDSYRFSVQGRLDDLEERMRKAMALISELMDEKGDLLAENEKLKGLISEGAGNDERFTEKFKGPLDI